ncbi:MAG: hypothetical protein P4N41_19185 [Negativicutes bacterium]|nr:hypothetical protein [Negativicutes bacterium]
MELMFMYETIKHECGARAHLVNKSLVAGWNLYCCNRCGTTFFKWITKEMFDKASKAQ